MATLPLDPKLIPKYVDHLIIPPVYSPTIVTDPTSGAVVSHDYTISMNEFQEQILPAGVPNNFPKTPVWGYSGTVIDPVTGNPITGFQNAPAATFEAIRGIPINVQWINNVTGAHPLPVDPTLHWADPNNIGMQMGPFPPFPPGITGAQSPVPLVPHLHGGESESASDGHPDAWFTAGGITGPGFVKSRYTYHNTQDPTTLWYHDHALGMTRLNVLMGLAGFYLLRDPNNTLDQANSPLPKGKYEIPIVIQDRSFYTDGSFAFPNVGIDPTIHPYWMPEFFGNSIMVNGKTWPNLNVDRRQYRFRLLNGSNARFYNLSFSNKMSFVQIGSDGGYLPTPVTLTSLVIAPGERADIVIDFSGMAAGTKIILQNDAKAPFPGGAPADPQTVGQIMQFTVSAVPKVTPIPIPTPLNSIPTLVPSTGIPKRIFTLFEIAGPKGPLMVTLNGQKWAAPIDAPDLHRVGSTEEWDIINTTMDAHPIHLHLIQFQIVSRQKFQSTKYTGDWLALNGSPPYDFTPTPLPVLPYLQGSPVLPPPNEKGWKDTVQAFPGEVITIRARFAPQNAPIVTLPDTNLFPFDPTLGPGYVWHCHIIDHEDNEMMRPYKVIS